MVDHGVPILVSRIIDLHCVYEIIRSRPTLSRVLIPFIAVLRVGHH